MKIQWIPISERQPEYTSDYLVTVGINYDGSGMFDCIRVASYNIYFGWSLYDENNIHTLFGDITAWAELPEIYDPEETENKVDINDYISRKSVLKTLDDMDKVLDIDRTVEEYKALLIECFKVLPSKDITEEFENIKTEIAQIDKIYYPDLSFNETGDCYIQRKSVAEVIDRNIAKLKGEQK